MKKALILGGSYFIGRQLAQVLLEHGFAVYTLNRGTRKDVDPRIHLLTADRNDPEQMRAALSGHSFDIAADISGLDGAQTETVCRFLNISRLGVFVFLSSSAVYDIDKLTQPYKETDPLKENKYWTFYGQNKIYAEQVYTRFFIRSGIPLVILRPPYVYGENNYAQRESFVFEHLLNRKPIITPKANNRIQFIEARDLAETILFLIGSPVTENAAIYNVGNVHAVTFREWVESCGRAAGILPEIIEYDNLAHNRKARDFFPFFDYDNVLNVKKIKRFYPKETDFIKGLEKTYGWYLHEKDNIVLKPQMTDNERNILIEIHETREKA